MQRLVENWYSSGSELPGFFYLFFNRFFPHSYSSTSLRFFLSRGLVVVSHISSIRKFSILQLTSSNEGATKIKWVQWKWQGQTLYLKHVTVSNSQPAYPTPPLLGCPSVKWRLKFQPLARKWPEHAISLLISHLSNVLGGLKWTRFCLLLEILRYRYILSCLPTILRRLQRRIPSVLM